MKVSRKKLQCFFGWFNAGPRWLKPNRKNRKHILWLNYFQLIFHFGEKKNQPAQVIWIFDDRGLKGRTQPAVQKFELKESLWNRKCRIIFNKMLREKKINALAFRRVRARGIVLLLQRWKNVFLIKLKFSRWICAPFSFTSFIVIVTFCVAIALS